MTLSDYVTAYEGQKVTMMMKASEVGAWESYDVRYRARVEKFMSRYADCGPSPADHCLNSEQLNYEGSHPDGTGGKVGVWAFKAYQLRAYGGLISVGGKQVFLITDIDKKKRDRADQNLLKRCAKEVGRCRGEPSAQIKETRKGAQKTKRGSRRKKSQ